MKLVKWTILLRFFQVPLNKVALWFHGNNLSQISVKFEEQSLDFPHPRGEMSAGSSVSFDSYGQFPCLFFPCPHLGHGAHCSGGLRINLDHLGVFMCIEILTHESHCFSSPSQKQLAWTRSNPCTAAVSGTSQHILQPSVVWKCLYAFLLSAYHNWRGVTMRKTGSAWKMRKQMTN